MLTPHPAPFRIPDQSCRRLYAPRTAAPATVYHPGLCFTAALPHKMTVIKQEDLIQSVADSLQYISYYHPMDYAPRCKSPPAQP